MARGIYTVPGKQRAYEIAREAVKAYEGDLGTEECREYLEWRIARFRLAKNHVDDVVAKVIREEKGDRIRAEKQQEEET